MRRATGRARAWRMLGPGFGLALGLVLAACGSGSVSQHATDAPELAREEAAQEATQEAAPVGEKDTTYQQDKDSNTSEETMKTCTIRINDKTFEVQLADNATGQAFAELLPLDLTMEELNGNEKYHYLDQALPASPSCPGRIEAGDLMLYGRDCVVLFYQSFDTSYSYTRIGRLADTTGLSDAVGTADVDVSFAR